VRRGGYPSRLVPKLLLGNAGGVDGDEEGGHIRCGTLVGVREELRDP
jgi:hypothetical protein